MLILLFGFADGCLFICHFCLFVLVVWFGCWCLPLGFAVYCLLIVGFGFDLLSYCFCCLFATLSLFAGCLFGL